MFGRILVGLLFAALGIVVLKYSYYIKNFFGSWGWAEKYLGSGGTYNAWKLIGLGLMVFGLLWATDTFGEIVRNTIGIFFTGLV